MGHGEGYGQLWEGAANACREFDELLDDFELDGVSGIAGSNCAGSIVGRSVDKSMGWSLRYLPVRNPKANGLQTSTPIL